MRGADDRAIGARDDAVTVHVHEPDTSRPGRILTRLRGAGPGDGAVGGGIGGVGKVAVRLQAVEGAYRGPDLVDDGGTDARTDRAKECQGGAVDRDDLVRVVCAVQRDAPHLVGADGAAVGDGEIKPVV